MGVKNWMKKGLAALLLGSVLCGCCSCGSSKQESVSEKEKSVHEEGGWDLAEEIVEEVENNQPEFADYHVDIEEFGGVYLEEPLMDSVEDKEKEAEIARKNMAALKEAMKKVSSNQDKKSNKAGGTITIRAGYFYTGPITMESNVNLELEKDANVMFSTDYSLYENVLTRWEGILCYNYSPFIYAYQKENIAITGEGTFDGQATKEKYWLPWKNGSVNPQESQAKAKEKLRQMGEDQTPLEDRVFGEGSYLRPSFVQPYECTNVLLKGVTIKNAPFWMVHPVFCTNVAIQGVTVNSFGYNNDGINPDSCNYVLIEDCTLNTGDDAIAIKSGLNKDGYTIGIPSSHIVVRNNTYLTGKGSAATVGSDMSGGVRYIYFLDSKSEETCDHLQSISIKTNGDRGGTIEQIYISGLESVHVEDYAVYMTMEYEEGDTQATTPVIKDIFIKDCKLTGGDKGTIGMVGYDRSPIQNVHFNNCSFTNCNHRFSLWNIKGLYLEGCTFDGEAYPDGEFVPAADKIEIMQETARGEYITVNYSCGALESNMALNWYMSDAEDGEYVPVTQEQGEIYHKIMEEKFKVADKEKYYKLGITVDGEEFLTSAYHIK